MLSRAACCGSVSMSIAEDAMVARNRVLKDCPLKASSLSGVRWRRWRTHGEFIIGFSDQCERNYPLDRSRSGTYLRSGKRQHDKATA